jgi:DNA-binding MarR family transcriptional regulator
MFVDGEYAMIARELGMLMRRATRLHDKRDDPDGYGLDRTAYMLLGRIVNDGPARLSALAGGMCVDLSVISRQVAALEAAGLVTRAPDPGDRRASVIAPTPEGIEVFQRRLARFVETLRTLLDGWSPEDRAEFARLMGRFNGALAAHDEEKQAWLRR